jgi:hypothetical protein
MMLSINAIQSGFTLRAEAWFPGIFGAAAAKDEGEAQAYDDDPEDKHEHGEVPQVPLPQIAVGHASLRMHRWKNLS